MQKTVERDDARYFDWLDRVLEALRPLAPTVSITGGEPSLDPRLPAILRLLADARDGAQAHGDHQRLRPAGKARWTTGHRLDHGMRCPALEYQRGSSGLEPNSVLMQLPGGLSIDQLRDVVAMARAGGTRVRLSCVLIGGAIDSRDGIRHYLDFAAKLGVDNVIFRQLMKTDPATAFRQSRNSF